MAARSEWVADDRDDEDEGHLDEFRNRVREVWEQIHLEKMLSEADKYLQALPNHPLEWMYFGQIPMGVRVIDEDVHLGYIQCCLNL
ncbi:hypothetical protein VTN96DRAFT_4131 [Rasamsonia emersonii]